MAVKRLHPIFATRLQIGSWSVRLTVRTPGFHPGNTGSIPVRSTKPLMQMRGFFNATQRRKLAFVSWGALKKPNEHAVFV